MFVDVGLVTCWLLMWGRRNICMALGPIFGKNEMLSVTEELGNKARALTCKRVLRWLEVQSITA